MIMIMIVMISESSIFIPTVCFLFPQSCWNIYEGSKSCQCDRFSHAIIVLSWSLHWIFLFIQTFSWIYLSLLWKLRNELGKFTAMMVKVFWVEILMKNENQRREFGSGRCRSVHLNEEQSKSKNLACALCSLLAFNFYFHFSFSQYRLNYQFYLLSIFNIPLFINSKNIYIIKIDDINKK